MTNYRVLVINGGGVRGIVPAKILQEMVKISGGKEINELFDCIVGTSIGGIIAAALTVKGPDGNAKYKINDVVNLFLEESEKIFPVEAYKNNNLFSSKYSREGLDSVLNQYFGESKFSTTTIPIIMVSYSLDLDGPRVWSSFKAKNLVSYDLFLKDGAGATSAAPTYFPPKVTKDSASHTFHDVDGGIFANSPTFIGISEIINNNRSLDIDDITVVSIGTGKFKTFPLLDSYIEKGNSFSLSALVSAGAGLTAGLLGFACKGIAGSCGHNINALWPVSILSTLSTAFTFNYVYYSNFLTGALHWITKGDLVIRMMQGSEDSDVIASTHVFRAIRINPDFTKGDDDQYRELDKADHKHMQAFAKRVEKFVKYQPNHDLLEDTVSCLEADNPFIKSCNASRILSHDLFGTQFYYDNSKKFYYSDTETSDLIGANKDLSE